MYTSYLILPGANIYITKVHSSVVHYWRRLFSTSLFIIANTHTYSEYKLLILELAEHNCVAMEMSFWISAQLYHSAEQACKMNDLNVSGPTCLQYMVNIYLCKCLPRNIHGLLLGILLFLQPYLIFHIMYIQHQSVEFNALLFWHYKPVCML